MVLDSEMTEYDPQDAGCALAFPMPDRPSRFRIRRGRNISHEWNDTDEMGITLEVTGVVCQQATHTMDKHRSDNIGIMNAPTRHRQLADERNETIDDCRTILYNTKGGTEGLNVIQHIVERRHSTGRRRATCNCQILTQHLRADYEWHAIVAGLPQRLGCDGLER